MLGGEVNVQTLKGTVSVKIPPESQQGSKLRLKNLGMPVHGSENSFGDLILSLQIVLPQHLSEQEKDLFRSLAEYRK
jgi:curved DNA-binding protein